MIQAIIFDADGMIVHGERFSDRLQRKFNISKEMTAPFFSGPFQQCIVGKANLRQVLPEYLAEWGYTDTLQSFLECWFEPKYNIIDLGFESIIGGLKIIGLKCYLATNNEMFRTDNLAHVRGLDKWFDKIFSSAYIGAKKPEPAFFDAIVKESGGLKKEEIAFFDDDPENVAGAKAYGFAAEIYTDFDSFNKKMKLATSFPDTAQE